MTAFPSNSEPQGKAGGGSTRPGLLLIDDDRKLCRLLQDYLEPMGKLRIRPGSCVALLGEEPLTLTPVEFDLLASLVRARGRVKTREQLLEDVAERNYDVFDRSIDVHISALRKKLGRLSQAINRLAARLAGFVSGQKRFLGDIAHELCSPLARVQVALGILEQRADAKQKAYVEDRHAALARLHAGPHYRQPQPHPTGLDVKLSLRCG